MFDHVMMDGIAMVPEAFFHTSCALTTVLGLLGTGAWAGGAEADRYTGPWDVPALQEAPTQVQWAEAVGEVRGLYYEGEPYRRRPTRVFAWCAMPPDAQASGKRYPAMVLVHGGGGTAFAEWARLWAGRGYVALAMDLAGRGPDRQPLEDGGPDQGGQEKFAAIRDGVQEVWSYHAVANVMRAVGVLADMDRVDPQRIGITGISWGGYLTCIVAGLDDRVRVAAPVYGCGYLDHNSSWLGEFDALGPEHAARWADNFDPSRYLPQARLPMLFVTGAKDPAYPLDAYQMSYRLVPGPVTLCIRPDMAHGHSPGWEATEIGHFVDAVLEPNDERSLPLATITAHTRDGAAVTVPYRGDVPVDHAQLHYTTDTGDWSQRVWHTEAMVLQPETCTGTLPASRPLVYFVTLTDARGATVSTPHETLAE